MSKYLFLVWLCLFMAQARSIIAQQPSVELAAFAERMPEYSGGQKMMEKFLKENLKYPQTVRTDTLRKTVIIEFLVTETGKLTDIKVARSSKDEDLDAEALRVVNLMPDWIPASNNGKTLPMGLAFPIYFKRN